jgi:glutamate-1-semialdehyde 2,1-aminomutase
MPNQTLTQSRSAALYERARQVMPGGCSRNTVLRKPHPLYVEKGAGCYVTDIEGVTRIDYANNMASLIHGHAHSAVVEAVTAQLQKGTAFTLATEVEIDFAEHICSRNAAFENIRFVNSGTEAVMGCLKAARAYTGRPKIAKVEGAYHGLYDYAEISQTANPSNWGDAHSPASVPVAYGTPELVLHDVIIIPFNQPGQALEILNCHRDELACVLRSLFMLSTTGLAKTTL